MYPACEQGHAEIRVFLSRREKDKDGPGKPGSAAERCGGFFSSPDSDENDPPDEEDKD